jgi:hypothetical protein
VDSPQEASVTETARLVDGSREPTGAQVADFIGKLNAARWAGVFGVEWLFGGKKYGWALRSPTFERTT